MLIVVCPQGRHVLWGWLQERRAAGSYDYSGCMTVPRLLYLEDERLIQVLHPAALRLKQARHGLVDSRCIS